MINILVAYDQQRAIGINNDLPWGKNGLPGDLAMFKRLTLEKTVVMGRKTFESIGHPLPERENIVVSRNPRLDIEGAICVNSLSNAIRAASKDVFIIGGAQIYKQAISRADTIFATEVKASFPDADTYFPEIDDDKWQQYYRAHNSSKDGGDQYDYDFVQYIRI